MIRAEEAHAEQAHEGEDQGAPYQAHQAGAHQKMAQADGGDELVLQAFGPDVVEQGIGQVQLGDLHGVHGDRADEDEGHGVGVQLEKAGEEPHGEDGHARPEEHLKDGKDIAGVDQEAPGGEGPHFAKIRA
jgi:hypothetical protein